MKEIEEALLAGRVDVAVHSAKDMTSTDAEGLAVGAYLPREDPRDALCGADALAAGMRIGTASVRRRAQLLALEPRALGRAAARKRRHASAQDAASAVSTRSCSRRRGSTGSGSRDEIGYRFDPDELVPEAGQGALALQVRAGEEALVAALDDGETRRRVEAERACVSRIGAGCLAPVAAHHDGEALTALIAAEDGSWIERRRGSDPLALADELLAAAVGAMRGRPHRDASGVGAPCRPISRARGLRGRASARSSARAT